MNYNTKRMIFISLACVLLAQGCVVAPKASELADRQVALGRWNQCLERHTTKARHLCDGHKRDVLAAFPNYMADRVSSKLSKQASIQQKPEFVRPLLIRSLNAATVLTDEDTLE